MVLFVSVDYSTPRYEAVTQLSAQVAIPSFSVPYKSSRGSLNVNLVIIIQ